MGFWGRLTKISDAVLFLFFLALSFIAPLIDSQNCLPDWLYHRSLLQVTSWYKHRYDDYLMIEKPYFFKGLIWVEITFLWPLSVANVYGIAAGKHWSPTTCLMSGVLTITAMAAIMAEFVGSGRASNELLLIYSPFVVIPIIAILKGLFSSSSGITTTSSSSGARGVDSSAGKKRA